MRHLALLALTALLLVSFAPQAARAEDPAPAAPTPEVSGRLETVEGVQILRLWGTPRERGFAHGWLLAESILHGFNQDLKALLGARAKTVVETMGPMLRRAFSFSPAEREELQGILDGIRERLPAEKRQIDLLGREVTLGDLELVNTVGDWYTLGCSSAALWGDLTKDGTPTVVRNFDFPALGLFVSPPHIRIAAPTAGETPRRGWVGISHPGCLGTLTSMNDAGVFVAIHDVGIRPQMKDFAQPNVPRLVAIRRLTEELGAEGACESARDKLRSWPTLYGNNFMIATPKPGDGVPAGVLEYDTREQMNQGVDLRPAVPAADGQPARSFVVCSNHHRRRASGRCGRYDRLVEGCRLDPPEPGRTIDDLFALASRSAVPSAGKVVGVGGFGTLHQAVARTGLREMWVRFVPIGENIRDAKPIRLSVPELLRTAKPPVR